ncbi:MAG: mechanosensitive ion channel family protein [Patescibacteria group bacterium]|nr:mechanosensitive ion channel family protein [Patescibacteria group bacterium]
MFSQLSQASWNITLLGNSVLDYSIALIALILFLIIFKIFQLIILSRLKKLAKTTETDIDDILIEAIRSLRPPFYYFLSIYFVLPFLEIKESVLEIINGILIILIVYQVIKAILVLVDYIFKKISERKDDAGTKLAFSYLSSFAKIMIWSFGLLLVLSNLGVNITSLVAGLGVGGIAFAFAMKNILGDLFSSFAIFFDKPFLPGDFIRVGDKSGTVKKIGIKTTRIQASQGEEIVFSNQELTSTQIHNFKKLKERKISFSFGVVYETPLKQIKKIPKTIKEIISEISKARFDRAHFNRFDDSALNFEVVYFVETDDYKKYMDIQQKINIKIMEIFEEEGIEMAYPTRVVYQK